MYLLVYSSYCSKVGLTQAEHSVHTSSCCNYEGVNMWSRLYVDKQVYCPVVSIQNSEYMFQNSENIAKQEYFIKSASSKCC